MGPALAGLVFSSQVLGAVAVEVAALGEVLARLTVGVRVAAALLQTVSLTLEHAGARGGRDLLIAYPPGA